MRNATATGNTYAETIAVFFETNNGYAEHIATFRNEELYITCLPTLERAAKANGFSRVTETCDWQGGVA